jgi:hypothetical protein
MFKITPECVQLLATGGDAAHSLSYFGNTYQHQTTFSLGQKTEAENTWCHLTDNTSNIYLLVTEPSAYSLWVLIDIPRPYTRLHLGRSINTEIEQSFFAQPHNFSSQKTVLQSPYPRGKAVPNLAIHLLQSLWLVITDLGGSERAKAFGREVVASNLPIDSEADLQACLQATPPPIEVTELDRGRQIIDRFQQLASRQVGLSMVTEVIDRLPLATPKMSRLF